MRNWKKRNKRKKRPARPELSAPLILAWADAHHRRTGQWPMQKSGPVLDGPLGENWTKVDAALRHGLRGLTGGSSLAKLLAAERGVRNRKALPPLTEDLILTWADAHFQRAGSWPHQMSGPIPEAPGENWKKMDAALQDGRRTLPGSSSLAQLLAERRGVRNRADLPPLNVEQILSWCDAHHARTGEWPRHDTGPIAEAPGETWLAVETSLRVGQRGLADGSSLAQLLTEQRGVRNKARLPSLSQEQILSWCDAYHRRTRRWPTNTSGPIPEAPGETWDHVARALTGGLRGLPGGSSLASLLSRERGVRNRTVLTRLTLEQIRAWAKSHRERTGQCPDKDSGPIPEAPGETWGAVESALFRGGRGLPGGYSLARLLGHGRWGQCDMPGQGQS